MSNKNRFSSVLSAVANAELLMCLFPFIVLTEGLGFGGYIPWHYPALYAVYAVFMLCGRLCGAWVNGGSFTSKQWPWALFASRAAVIVPAAVFIIVCACTGLPTSLYFYAFPGAVIAFFGGHRSVGLGYGDIMTVGWFAGYFVGAIAASLLLLMVHEEDVRSDGIFQLCIMFGVLIVLSAVLANQTNIDIRTRQRSAGRNILPKGLRGYNAAVIAGVCAAAAGLFLFAKPLAELVSGGLAALVSALISFIYGLGGGKNEADKTELDMSSLDGELTFENNSSIVSDIMTILIVIGVIILIVKFRRQIAEVIRDIIAPLFREKEKPEPLPFADEISDSVTARSRKSDARKTEQQLLRAYRKEQDPVLKYRKGYLLFMLRLNRSAFPCLPSDTTTVQGKKGVLAFRRSEIDDMVGEYNEIRYGGKTPGAEQLSAQERLLNELY